MSDDLFEESEKLIFQHTIGAGADGKPVMVWGDPLALWNQMVRETEGELNEWAQATAPVIEKSKETGEDLPEQPGQQVRRALAEERFLGAVSRAFGMLPYDRTTGQGATMRHCWDAWFALKGFLEGEGSGDDSLPDGSTSSAGLPAVPSPIASLSAAG
jgi:hypothetical protein